MALELLNLIAILLGGSGLSFLLMGFLFGGFGALILMAILEIVIISKESKIK